MANSTVSKTTDQGNLPTLEDVARKAGVSTATVSRCLNSPGQVAEHTRTKVMSAVSELGYAPNFGAQALAAKRTNTFGAIIPTMENAIFATGVQAFQEALDEHGITLLVASSSYAPETEEQQARALVARGADALLLIGYDRMPETYAFLKKRRIPFVVAWAHDEAEEHSSIGFDNRAAMATLAQKVIELGHTNLALIVGKRDGNDRARARVQGVHDAMISANLDPGTLDVIETTYSIDSGAKAFEDLMRKTPRPTVVLGGNDVLAAGALRKARSMGLSVPRDVSITGFDDIEIASLVTPTLTTVAVPHKEMGLGAAKILTQLRNGTSGHRQTKLETEIRWRESLGPVPKQ